MTIGLARLRSARLTHVGPRACASNGTSLCTSYPMRSAMRTMHLEIDLTPENSPAFFSICTSPQVLVKVPDFS